MNAHDNPVFQPGTAVCIRDGSGFIAEYKPKPEGAAQSFLISRAFEKIGGDYVIVLLSGAIIETPDVMARDYVSKAREYGWPDVPDHAERYAAAKAAKYAAQDAARRDREEYAERLAAFHADGVKRIPSWAQAVIVAEYIEDRSDSMSDYYSSTTKRTVILAFSKHKRELFPEMRAATRHFPETAHLADAPDSAEHREKYSMGAGFYLKTGGRHWTGWQVRKLSFYGENPVRNLPLCEWHLALVAETAKPAPVASGGTPGMRIEKHRHTKHGFDMWLCVMADRVERTEFDRLMSEARALGGWYSKPWGGTPGGFAFKRQEAAEQFAGIGAGPDGGGDGAFKESGTGVATVLAWIDKV